jgi:hypothetical protein
MGEGRDWIDRIRDEREGGYRRALSQDQHERVNARFPGLTRECCFLCGAETGRAGAAEDSIFDDNGDGPYCEECFAPTPTPAEGGA